jgi:hypothetical protein
MKPLFMVAFFLGLTSSFPVLTSSGAGAADLSVYGELFAAPPPQVQTGKSPFELRLGAVAHDPKSPEASSADLNAELLFGKFATSPDYLWNLLIPRPHIGATINFVGKTSNVYAGVTWDVDIYRGLFLEGAFGGAANDGYGGLIVPAGHNAMGCNVSFRESGSIGYHIDEKWSVMATIEHYSNKGYCDPNRGLTNYGMRLGYAF